MSTARVAFESSANLSYAAEEAQPCTSIEQSRSPTLSSDSLHSLLLQRGQQNLLRAHSRSFHLASRFLPAEIRSDVRVCYAFCRTLDDFADAPELHSMRRSSLLSILAMLQGRTSSVGIIADFMALLERRSMSVEPALDLLQGMISDLEAVQIEEEQELDLYCYRAAGSVGVMMCELFGVQSASAKHAAACLGKAMQLTNICRDVLEDSERGRYYLPGLKELLQAREPALRAREFALRSLVLARLAQAERLYSEARRGYAELPPRVQFTVIYAAQLYRAIGLHLAHRLGGNPLLGRSRVPRLQQLRLVLSSLGELRKLRRAQRKSLPLGP